MLISVSKEISRSSYLVASARYFFYQFAKETLELKPDFLKLIFYNDVYQISSNDRGLCLYHGSQEVDGARGLPNSCTLSIVN